MKTITPIGEKVVLKYVKRDEVTKGGIVIPKTAKDHQIYWIGEVLAVGPGKLLDNGQRVTPDVKVGDRVIVPLAIETEIEDEDGNKLAMVLESQLLGVIES